MKNESVINETENAQGEIHAVEQEQTAVEQKAAAILRARLPLLMANGLNFEKRTGAFFRATLEAVKDDEGNFKLDEKGEKIEKMRRTVVAPEEIPAEIAEEVAAKRAAALIASAESKRESAAKAVEEAKNAFAEAAKKAADLDAEIEAAATIVEAFNLPEKAQRERVSASMFKEQAEKAMNEAERLRNLLISMGIDPDKAE